MGHIKRSALQESEVLIPSANVMVELNAEMQPVVDEMIGLKVQSCKLGELRDALLPKLISGEIDVSEVELPMQPNNQLSGVLAPGSDAATAAVLRNMSDAPVYNVIITCVGISGAGPNAEGEDNGHDYPCRACVGTLPPGTRYAWPPTNGPGMHVRTAPEAAFTDANGRSWVRRGNGKLEEIETEPVSFYGLGLPVSWGECKRLD